MAEREAVPRDADRAGDEGRPAHEAVARWARRTPDAPAVTCADGSLTYRELDERANRLAHHLRSLGVGRDVVVAIHIARSLDHYVALLGVLKIAMGWPLQLLALAAMSWLLGRNHTPLQQGQAVSPASGRG